MTFPANLKYTEDHEWLRVEGDVAYVGITEFAQDQLGDIVYVEVDTVGDTLDKGEEFGTVEAVKTTSELYMPITGKVLEFNPKLDENDGDNPTLINSDPYGDGWIIKIKISDASEIDEMLDADAYAEIAG